MSNRDSLGFGDMVPQDVVDIFAHEKQGKNGRKKRSRSLGRALGWLKGKRRKDLEANRSGLSPSLDLALDVNPAGHKGGHRSGKQAHAQGNSHAIPKRDNDDDKTLAPPLFQENVFIESSRPKYLEDLHTEALEGLKMMQQEETTVGVDHQDNESTISTMSVQTDGECGGFTTDSTIPDTSSVVSMKSSVSTQSSRSGLTRQGSTFRPLNSGTKSEKSRSRRRHRKTVAGIPQHVQKELGLDRVGWMMAPNLDEEQFFNGESDYSSTTEGPESPDGVSPSLRSTNVVHPLSKDRVEQHAAAHAGLGADLGLLHHLDPRSAEQRPHSLVAPWVNSTSAVQQEPPSPVMSMSPQAAYMSKIIPNAVLPPSIDVVEISRGRSRNSVRTVSKSSLVLSSPAPSRASSRASSRRTTSSKASTITSASRHNKPSLSDSNWSDSSDTLVSDSSTISTSSTPRQRSAQEGDAKEDKSSVHSNGKLLVQGDDAKKDGQFGRSLSIMKAKRAPPPPSRSYSLHAKMKRRSRDLAEVKIDPVEHISAQGKDKPASSPVSTSPGYNADTSSLDDSTESGSFSPNKALTPTLKPDVATPEHKQASRRENKQNNTISPSSGYSSREASSPKPPKQSLNASPKPKKGIFAKLQRLFPGSASSAPSSAAHAETPEGAKSDPVDKAVVSPSVQALRDLFDIPRHPKVHAPPPPPPEVWAHSKRTFELLLGPPAPENVYAIIKKNPKDRRQQRPSPSASPDASVRSLAGERKQHGAAAESVNGSVLVQNAKKVQESGVLIADIHRENTERLAQNVDVKESGKDEKVRGSDILNSMLAKAVEKRKERLAARKEDEMKMSAQAPDTTPRVDTVPAVSLARSSPSPSPALGCRIVLPPPTQTTPTVVVSPESSWPPPPPPPVTQVSPSGTDDLDFPLPPPPSFAEGAPVLPVLVPPAVTTNAETLKPGTSQENEPQLSIPPPPPYTAPPPPVTISPLTIRKMPSPLPVIEEVVTPPPVEVLAVRPKDSSAPVLHGAPPFLPATTPTPVTVVSPPVEDVEVLLPPDSIPPPPPQLNASQLSAEATSVGSLTPPQSIPPPPPPPISTQQQASHLKVVVPREGVPHETSSSDSILAPPESIPPPPPVDLLLQAQITTMKTNNLVPSPEKAPDSMQIKAIPPPVLDHSKERTSAPAVQEDSAPMVTPSLLHMVKLRSVNSSPEPPKAEERPQAEVKMRKRPPGNVPTSSSSGEAPQKPIRKSLIVTSPTSTTPPAIATPPKSVSPPALESSVEKSSSSTAAAPSVVLPASTVTCTVETSCPAPSEAPPVSSSTSTPVEKAPPATAAASPENPAPAAAVVSSVENSETTVGPSVEVSAPSTVVSSVENSVPETTIDSSVEVSAAPTVAPTVEKSVPETTVAPPVEVSPASVSTVVSSVENCTPDIAVAPSVEVTAASTVVSSAENSAPETIAAPSIEVTAASTVVSSVENSLPETIVDSPVEVCPAPASTVDSVESSSPAPTDAPTVSATLTTSCPPVETPVPAPTDAPTVSASLASSCPPVETPVPAPTDAPTVVVSSASSSTVLTSVERCPPAAPASSPAATSPPAEKSPPATVVVPPIVVSPTPKTTVVSPVKKSPSATAAPSMNLQEAIRLRTAARSKAAPASRLSLHSPTSPKDFRKSPTSTASFIFSKSNKKVVIETKPEAPGEAQKSPALSPFAKAVSEAESLKKGGKVPPPVAKKPKSKGKDAESSEGTEEAQPETIGEKTNGTAGPVEGEGST